MKKVKTISAVLLLMVLILSVGNYTPNAQKTLRRQLV
jgi:hypothetical protein